MAKQVKACKPEDLGEGIWRHTITQQCHFSHLLCICLGTHCCHVRCQFGSIINKAVTTPAAVSVLSLWVSLSALVRLFILICIVSVCGRVHLSVVSLGGQKHLFPFMGTHLWVLELNTGSLYRISPGLGSLPSQKWLYPLSCPPAPPPPPKVLTLIFKATVPLYKFLYVCELRVKVHSFANKYTFDPGPFVEKIKLPPAPPLHWGGLELLFCQ